MLPGLQNMLTVCGSFVIIVDQKLEELIATTAPAGWRERRFRSNVNGATLENTGLVAADSR